ncbi:MAG: hypothetical protein MMC33_006682 [Icmadophila ericetorum]|nr:hypothetical protein [Icmadophila ericetorum]
MIKKTFVCFACRLVAFNTAIATLDFSKFTNGNSEERSIFAKELSTNLKQYGFVRLLNHGVPDEISYGLLNQAKRLFGTSRDEKSKIANKSGTHPQRGWSGVGIEHTSKLRKENLSGGTGEDLTNEKVTLYA